MIDFRYHLISIIAVFLALGIGVLMGSAFLGDPIIRSFKNQAQDLTSKNSTLRTTNEELRRDIKNDDSFALTAQPWLVAGRLARQNVVVVTFEGTDSGLVDDAEQDIRDAGGAVASTVTLNAKIALADGPARDELAVALGSSVSKAAELRTELARELARRLAAAGRGGSGSEQPLTELMDKLAKDGFLSLDGPSGAADVPQGSLFAVVGGSPDPPPFDVTGFTVPLARRLTRDAIMVAEPVTSQWNLVASVRDDSAARAIVSTDDQVDTPEGAIALVLGLGRDAEGQVGHYGVKPGAEEIIPAPTPSG